MEDAVLHGCIPVILQDGVHAPWESVLDAPSFSIRVQREEMPSLISTLRAIPPSRVRELQESLAAVWPRFSYMGAIAAEEARRNGRAPAPNVAAAAQHDATATLLQVLKARLMLREARRTAAGGGTHAATLRPKAGCDADAAGGDISSADDLGPERGFEGRTVNGWVI